MKYNLLLQQTNCVNLHVSNLNLATILGVAFIALSIALTTATSHAIAIMQNSKIEELSWMAGYWTSEHDGVFSEEFWMLPKGGLMVGSHRDVCAGKRTFFEYLRIEQTESAITYYGGPMGKTPTPFKMIECNDRRVVFENKGHDFPQRIIYWRDIDEDLCARVEGDVEGKLRSEEWVWKKTDLQS